MREAAAAGPGAAIAPEPLVADDLAAGLIPSGMDYVVIRREGASRRARAFCEWIGAEARG
jgi:DNA-binding transcriptional LysR family regulator